MKKNYLLAIALAIMTMASCSDDNYVGDQEALNSSGDGNGEISFGGGFKAITRADHVGADAADLLGGKFYVGGYKHDGTNYSTVFDHYLVQWGVNTAGTTADNTSDWKYVGLTPLGFTGHITSGAQTLKYWDFAANYYDFVAFSAGKDQSIIITGTPETNQILATAIDQANLMTAAYTLTGSATDLGESYIADLVTAVKSGAGSQQVNYKSESDYNKAHVTFAAGAGDTPASTMTFSALNYETTSETLEDDRLKYGGNTNTYLKRTAAAPSFAGTDPYYVTVLPDEAGNVLELRVDYTLEAIDGTQETIKIHGAKAFVPQVYAQWKPNYAYTYIFKISDNTNGWTSDVDTDPAGLYPITFDAVVVNAEDNDATQETITLVATPSITTYQQASTVVNADEYTVNGQDIFVTVNEGDNLVTLTGKAALYSIPAGRTEADVVDAMQMQDDDAAAGTVKGRSGLVLTNATSTLTNSVEFGADGNAISVATDQALRFTPTASTTYAFVYTKTAPTSTENKFQPVTKAEGDAVSGLYRYNLVAATAGDVQKGVTYFENSDASTNAITAFLGQGVGNLYLDAAGNTIAKGYAVTGTTYYYTIDHGMNYKAAHNVDYADFAAATDLYTFNGTEYTLKTDAAPVDGTAYYKRTGEGTPGDPYVYTYCVILPQQTTGLYVIDDAEANRVACGTTDTAVKGMTYFDKYTKNNGEYYTKVIKVQ